MGSTLNTNKFEMMKEVGEKMEKNLENLNLNLETFYKKILIALRPLSPRFRK